MTLLHTPLSPDRQEIRVVILSPSQEEDEPIECRLQVVSLKESPEYEALSYVWGDNKSAMEICLNDGLFPVGENLAIALLHLRRPTESRTLWIDFICIDQENTTEKSHQVALMGQIYSRASSVITWLGPPTPEIQLAMSWIETFVHKKYTWEMLFWWKLMFKAALSAQGEYDLNYILLLAKSGCDELIRAPYWSRMWTFQEYMLPEKEPICMSGNIEFSWSEFLSHGQKRVSDASRTMRDKLLRDLNTTQDAQTKEHLRQFSALAAVNNAKMRNNLHNSCTTDPRHGIPDPKICNLLWESANRKCGDPRDKVYALYSMCPDIEKAFPADYSKPINTVLLETAVYIIRHEWLEDIFDKFMLRKDHLSDTSLPSWVPDLTTTRASKEHTLDRRREVPFDLGVRNSLIYRPDISLDLSVLRLWGRYGGKCRVVFRFTDDGTDERTLVMQIMKHLHSHLDLASGIGQKDDQNMWSSVYDHETLWVRFLMSCFVGAQVLQDHPLQEILESLDRMLDSVAGGERTMRPDTQLATHLKVRLSTLAGKTVFLVDGENVTTFGIGDAGVCDGDVVIAPALMSHPVVLRKDCGHQGLDAEDYYRMVGLAYIWCLTQCQSPASNPFAEDVESCSIRKWHIR